VTVPATLVVPGPIKVNVEGLMVAGFIALLKVALIIAVSGQTDTLLFGGGVTSVTVGGVVAHDGEVVNVHT
jgi:hypothetical protein